ncbi:hypothetical protein AKJ09_05192 [Labilithrix luteola]|uniref:Uncharacterized protein n=1 Tax=Labilithrix luteola TaxID=1391654 RepID=A0A0K1PYC3_9BACT|nr:hypothetical protein [Labilithrix luteola]AKU98528.1 hypothetical protein AKJ09_05192 [Labilithrix luteola]
MHVACHVGPAIVECVVPAMGEVLPFELGDAGTNAFYAMLKFVDGDFALDPRSRPPNASSKNPPKPCSSKA